MSIKINIKDIPAQASAQGSDQVLVCWGANQTPALVRLDQLGVAPVSGATGMILTCQQNGYSYSVYITLVDGQAAFALKQVNQQGQYTSLWCDANNTVYQLSVQLVNGQPTIIPVPVATQQS